MILLLPGPSAAGRDFLLQQLLDNSHVVGERIGFSRPLKAEVLKKTTTRPARAVDLLKISIPAEEFTKKVENGQIIGHYTLESNGHRYGYDLNSLQSATDADIMVGDASVYQIPDLKTKLGNRIHTSAMVASRQYRHQNLRDRKSETEEEMVQRLNLGDAHVAIAILMHDDPGVSYYDFVPAEFADNVAGLVSAHRVGRDTTRYEQAIEAYSKSRPVVDTIKHLAQHPAKYIDELAILSNRHRQQPGDPTPLVNTPFFELGVSMISSALGRNGHRKQEAA